MQFKFADKVVYIPENPLKNMLSQFEGRIGIVVGVDALDEAWTYVGYDGQFKLVPVPTRCLTFFIGEVWYYTHPIGTRRPIAQFSTKQRCIEHAMNLSKEKNDFPYLIVHEIETLDSEIPYESYIVMGSVIYKPEI